MYNEKGVEITDPNDPAFLNPLRYRSYYYDDETGFYYLKSRYYNPEWGRFISADSVVSGTGESVNGYNVYSYCFNNPITLTDPSGCWPEILEELYSRFKHTTKTFGRIITAPFKALEIEAGVGIGFGFKTKINLKNIPIEIEAIAAITDSLFYKRGEFGSKISTSLKVCISIAEILGLSCGNSIEHSYSDKKCTCDFWDSTYLERYKCGANHPAETSSSKIGISFGGYFIIGFDFSIGIDLKVLGEEWLSVFHDGMSYGE